MTSLDANNRKFIVLADKHIIERKWQCETVRWDGQCGQMFQGRGGEGVLLKLTDTFFRVFCITIYGPTKSVAPSFTVQSTYNPQFFDSLWRRGQHSKRSTRIYLQWPNHLINCVDKTKPSFPLSHRRSTKVSVETNPLIIKRVFWNSKQRHLFSICISKDTFVLKNVADVGEITAIALKRDEAGWFPKWQLSRVSHQLIVKSLKLFSNLKCRLVFKSSFLLQVKGTLNTRGSWVEPCMVVMLSSMRHSTRIVPLFIMCVILTDILLE